MASNLKILASTRNALGDALISAIGNAATIKIYDGTQPAGPATAITSQVLLGTLTGGSPFAGATSGGVVTANSITQDSAADATSTATWFRISTSGGAAILDGTVGTSGCDLNLNTTSIVTGGPIVVSSLTVTIGGG